MRICVYCSSSDRVHRQYRETAERLGRLLGEGGHTLVYGGAAIGLMGMLARAVQRHGSRVVGVIPELLHRKEISFHRSDELIVTEDMRRRKEVMERMAEAFVGLPGGFGTLEELLEVITLKQLGCHTKPVVLVNRLGFFDHLLRQFDRLYREGFTSPVFAGLYHAAAGPREALEYLREYRPLPLPEKWR
jgi:hypothetical protein